MGPRGLSGPPGIRGARGERGLKGDRGLPGEPGDSCACPTGTTTTLLLAGLTNHYVEFKN